MYINVCVYMYVYIHAHTSKYFTYISSINVYNNLPYKYYYYTHFTDGKTEIQGG